MTIETITNQINDWMRICSSEFYPENNRIHHATKYALSTPGKRIRAILCYLWSKGTGNVDTDLINYNACAIEWMHAYSLVHDDLPCMDNDDFRRGKPTVHKAYDEATALLVGDTLLNDCYGLICSEKNKMTLEYKALAVQTLSQSCGASGMILGQHLDLLNLNQSHTPKMSLNQIENIHSLKTGGLIAASCFIGVLCRSSIKHEDLAKLKQTSMSFGMKLGLCYQIMDDVLDAKPNTGKSLGKDRAAGKITYLDLLGHDNAVKLVVDYKDEIIALATSVFVDHLSLNLLTQLVDKLSTRVY